MKKMIRDIEENKIKGFILIDTFNSLIKMGNYCSCCKAENKEKWLEIETAQLTPTIHEYLLIESQQVFEPELMSVKDSDTIVLTPLIDSDLSQSIQNSKELFKKLSPKQCKKLNITDLIILKDNSNLNFTECIEGALHSKSCVFKLENGSYYKGEFDGFSNKHGQGVEIKPNGTQFVGNYFHGLIQGPGRMLTKEKILLEGNFVNEGFNTEENILLDGIGSEIWPNGISYKGNYVKGVKTGKGKLRTKDAKYYGEFTDDLMNGYGKMTCKNGKKYEGQ